MILPLRRRHRLATVALALVLPLMFAAAIVARRPIPENPGSTAAREQPDPARATWTDARPVGPDGVVLTTRLRAGTRPEVELRLSSPLERPDVLAYWRSDRDRLPDALLLGAIRSWGGRFALPPEARAGGGTVVLYSRGHAQDLLVEVPLPTDPVGSGDPR